MMHLPRFSGTGLAPVLLSVLLLPACGKAQESRPPAAPPYAEFWTLPTGSRIAVAHAAASGRAGLPPIVFVHGGPGAYAVANFGAARDWWNRLAGLGFDVYVYDQVGSGLSARLKDPRHYTVRRHIADLDAIRLRIGAPRIILIGDSWGATLSAHYIAEHPEAVDRVIFTSPGPIDRADWDAGGAPPAPEVSPEILQWVRQNRGLRAWLRCRELERRLHRDIADAHAFAGDAEMDELFDAFLNARILPVTVYDKKKAPNDMHGSGWWVQTMVSWDQIAHPDRVRSRLSGFTRPVLILHGDADYLPSGMSRQYAEAFPAARLVEIPMAGHLLWIDRPDVYGREIVSFLKQVTDTAATGGPAAPL